MVLTPNLGSVPDMCAVCHQKVQLWDISKGPNPTGMLILDPETEESRAYHFQCADAEGHRWTTVHVGYFMPEKEGES